MLTLEPPPSLLNQNPHFTRVPPYSACYNLRGQEAWSQSQHPLPPPATDPILTRPSELCGSQSSQFKQGPETFTFERSAIIVAIVGKSMHSQRAQRSGIIYLNSGEKVLEPGSKS